MSINQEIVVKDPNAAIEAQKLKMQEQGTLEIEDDQQLPAIDKTKVHNNAVTDDPASEEEKGDYEGRKHQPKIDGPEQASQETDEVYQDPRDTAGLPPAGKNVGELNVQDLGKD